MLRITGNRCRLRPPKLLQALSNFWRTLQHEESFGTFYPAFKLNTKALGGGLFEKAFYMFNLNREEYLKHYHKRSNVESTFSSLKRKFGGDVRSKTTLAMKNEVLAKVVCHDITCVIRTPYELGIAPSVLPVPCTKWRTCTFNLLPSTNVGAKSNNV